jgi:Cdc6-like AAA superfamily ATPase
MEVDLAGANKKAGGFFWGRKRQANPDAPQDSFTVVRPQNRDAGRRGNPRDLLPHFHSLATDQAGHRVNDRFAGIRSKLRLAFAPSQPVADQRLFAGREEVLKTLIRAIEDQRLHTVLYGERGIGKTSLLHMLTLAAREARYIVVYSSCGANSTFDETFRAASNEIPLLFHSGFSPTTTEAEKGATLADLAPEGPLSPRKFGDLCSKLTNTRVLIILDEFDRCESGAFRRDVAELIKNLSDRRGRVQLVLAGVAADLTELVEHIPSIRRNIFALRVPKMPDKEVLQIVSNGEREAGLTFDPAASASVVAVSLGSPYIANLLCHHAGHAALDEGRSTVLPRDVSGAVDRAVGEFQARIAKPVQARIRALTEQGSGEALATAARAALSGDGSFGIAELQAYGDVDAKRAQQVLQLLSTENILMPDSDDDGGLRMVFAEEGLPTFIWMSWAQQNVGAEPGTARVGSRS